MNNLVPLPYSRIAVQYLEADLDEGAIRAFLRDKEVWFETDYVVFRRGSECAVATIMKTTPRNSFCRIVCVDLLSQPDRTYMDGRRRRRHGQSERARGKSTGLRDW